MAYVVKTFFAHCRRRAQIEQITIFRDYLQFILAIRLEVPYVVKTHIHISTLRARSDFLP